MAIYIRRREFIGALGSVVGWSWAARAQQGERVRRVAVLLGGLEFDDASGQAEVTAFEGGLKDLGWNSRPKYRP